MPPHLGPQLVSEVVALVLELVAAPALAVDPLARALERLLEALGALAQRRVLGVRLGEEGALCGGFLARGALLVELEGAGGLVRNEVGGRGARAAEGEVAAAAGTARWSAELEGQRESV